METLTLNDGTVVNGHIIDNGDGRTKKVTAMNHGTERVYEGYTELYHASHEYGNCNLTMRRGSDA